MGTAAPPSSPDSPVTAIGIDVGSTRTKVVLVEIGSTVRELAVRSGTTPKDPLALWSVIAESVRSVGATDSRPPVAIGIASMAESGIVIDRDDSPMGPIVRWDAELVRNRAGDRGRASERGTPSGGPGVSAPSGLFDTLTATDRAELSAATGVPPTAKVPLATWHRLARTDPERFSAMARWSGMADFVAERLTGEFVTDHTLAARTMAYRLPALGHDLPSAFDPAMLGIVGLGTQHLPRVLRPGDPAGTVTSEAATATGVGGGTPVFIAGHDHVVGAWAAGARTPARLANSIGTTEALLRITDADVDRRAALAQGMSVTRTVDGTAGILLSGSLGGALIARWFEDHPDADPHELVSDLDPPLPAGQFVLPYPYGRQSPFPDPGASEQLVGQATTLPEHFAALLTGLSLQLRWMVETQSAVIHHDPGAEMLVFGGRIAQNVSWLRAKSHLLGRRLGVVSADEPVAAGAALLAAVRAHTVPGNITLPRARFSAPDREDPPGTPTADALFATFTAATLSPNRGEHR